MKCVALACVCVLAAVVPTLAQSSSALADLIRAGNRKAALDRIRTGADVNEAQPDGTRPIHWAVYKVDYDLIAALIAKKATVDVVNEFGATPLAEAVKLADARIVKMLLEAGAGVDRADESGQTPLMLAIKTGELPVVEMLVKAGANVNAVEEFQRQTPLMWAVTAPTHAPEMTKLLLAKGANVRARALYTDWPNQLSSEPRAQYRPVGGLTALLYASRNGCIDCVAALIAAGADVNVPTPEGVTPLMISLDNDHNDVAALLLDRGANPHVPDWWGRTALWIAIDRKAATARGPAPMVSHMDIINRLLAADVDVNAELNMHRPSRGGNSGRFSDRQLGTGGTALYRAAEAGDVDVIRSLLAKGANPNINGMGFTPFLVAAGVTPNAGGGPPNMAVLDLMIQHGADVNAQVTGTRSYSMRVSYNPPPNKEGSSALHGAAQAGRTDLVRYLLGKGASPDLVDANGRKPIDLLDIAVAGRGAAAGAAGRGTGGRGGAVEAVSPAAAAEIRALLQGAASKAGRILRPNAVVHSVADLDRSVAFYRDAVGLTMEPSPGFPTGNSPRIGAALGAPGATIRAATLAIPGSDVRLTLVQFSGVPVSPTRQRLQDPGSVKLVVRVRDIDAAFARVRDRVARVYTDGGVPVKPEGPAAVNTSVIMRDPDGYPLELVLQDTPAISSAVPAASNIVGGWATFIVADVAASLEFYRTRLGFEAAGTPRPLASAVLSLQGTPGATGSMSAGMRPPGGVNTWRMYDFKNIDRARLDGRLQDPGTPAVSFRVDNVAALVARLKGDGVAVVSGPVSIEGATRTFVRDLNGLLLEFVEAE